MEYNKQQLEALVQIQQFIHSNKKIFFLKGYAGTGKTTIIKKICETNNNIKLLATTGRAAKIMSLKTGLEATTVHKEIFSNFKLKKLKNNLFQIVASSETQISDNSIYIIDEASMIGNICPNKEALNKKEIIFENEKLLENIINIILINKNKIIFVGDPLQLPPVLSEKNIAPALNKKYIQQNFGVDSEEVTLTSIQRQNANNGIIKNSLKIRNIIDNNISPDKYKIEYSEEVIKTNSKNAIKSYLDNPNETLIICRSNFKTLNYSNEIRKLLGYKNTLDIDDTLLVIKNNSKYNLMNGEIFKIKDIYKDTFESKKIRINEETIELKFVDVLVFHNFSNIRIKILINFLTDEKYPNNNQIIQSALIEFIKNKINRNPNSKDLLKDEYYNSLQVRYGYALTCHKAQGGEANLVFIENINIESILDLKWLYTAITRSQNKCFFIKDNVTNIIKFNNQKIENSNPIILNALINLKTNSSDPNVFAQKNFNYTFLAALINIKN